ncbi:MAG: hypothetical protein ABSC77_02130 [Terracidiphilus sp.]|jgi:hypothetical protein
MGTIPVAVPTVRARLLPGWMTRDEAITMFTTRCIPSRTVDESIAIWQEYRDRVAALPLDRGAVCPRIPLSPEEELHAHKFMAFLNQTTNSQHQITGVVKVELRQMIAHQYEVVTERSEGYAQRNQTAEAWRGEFLPTALPPAAVNVQFSLGLPNNMHPMSSQIIIDLPHAEFAFLPTAPGMFGASQFLRHVTVCEQGTKILLKAGYHRSFALFTSAPPATVPTAVVALERNTWVTPVNQPPAGVGVTVGTNELHFSGRIPALFSDFFSDGLFIDVLLRRKRFQLRVQSTWTAVDDV